jgi:YggT family protein
VGDIGAGFTQLADAIGTIESFVTVFIWVYILLIFAYVLSSWVRVPYSLQPLVRFLHDVCEPYLRLFRRVLPSLGPVDVSPIVAVFGLYVLQWAINTLVLDNLR